MVGASIGAVCAWLLFNGNSAQIASLSFPLMVTPGRVDLVNAFEHAVGEHHVSGVSPPAAPRSCSLKREISRSFEP